MLYVTSGYALTLQNDRGGREVAARDERRGGREGRRIGRGARDGREVPQLPHRRVQAGPDERPPLCGVWQVRAHVALWPQLEDNPEATSSSTLYRLQSVTMIIRNSMMDVQYVQ